ncbi:Carbonic anhydrase 6 [Halotydeus destructor]|nr:Carbonic anhydrase 6 [Halotydeus destructor]
MSNITATLVAFLSSIDRVNGAGGGMSHHEINYFKQEKWPLLEDAQCAGSAQSPIDINTKAAIFKSVRVRLINYDKTFKWEVVNNGHADQADIIPLPFGHQVPELKFKGQTFKFEQLHFHWGSNDRTGSEHTINGERYPLEIHVVHHNSKHRNVTTALGHDLGVLVFAAMVDIDGPPNKEYAPLADTLNSIADVEDKKVAIEQLFALEDLLPEAAAESVYMYTGSLTTPPCTEKVQWIMSSKVQYISKAQMAQFRQLRRSDNVPVSPNFRKVHPLNGRIVTKNFGSSRKWPIKYPKNEFVSRKPFKFIAKYQG